MSLHITPWEQLLDLITALEGRPPSSRNLAAHALLTGKPQAAYCFLQNAQETTHERPPQPR